MTPTTGKSGPADYCVQGTRLTVATQGTADSSIIKSRVSLIKR